MDKALALGDVPVTLPFVKKKSVESVRRIEHATSTEAAEKLPTAFAAIISRTYPDVYARRSQDIRDAG